MALTHSSLTSFATNLQQQLRKKTPGNFVYSPLGVTLCCSLAYVGADGNTKDEMQAALNYPENEATPIPTNVINLFKVDSRVFTLNISQQVFIEKGYAVRSEYLAALKKLKAGVEQIDNREPQRSANAVNSWVRQATKGEIKEIVTVGALQDSNLRLLLINTVYFYGRWETPFKKESTKPQDFFLNDGKTVKVPMMNLHGCQRSVDYVNSKKLNAQIIKLAYKDKRFSMLVFIPNIKNGLATMEDAMLTTSVQDCMNELRDFRKELRQCILSVCLPKFEFHTDLNLIEPLNHLGIRSAFDINQADFSLISDDPNGLFISTVVQKAMIKVDEMGTTAAAATCCSNLLEKGRPRPKKEIHVVADHPFYFQIIQENMQLVLFSGVVTNPSLKR